MAEREDSLAQFVFAGEGKGPGERPGLPPGDPLLGFLPDITQASIGRFSELLSDLALHDPLDFFRLLKFIPPEQRLALLRGTELRHIPTGIARMESWSTSATEISSSARGALGDENVNRLVLNLSAQCRSPDYQYAAMVFARGMALEDLPPVFASYGNLARATGIRFAKGERTAEMWVKLLLKGVYNLYIAAYDNDESGIIPKDRATQIVNDILRDDLFPYAERIGRKPKISFGTGTASLLREHITDPSAIDDLMGYFGLTYVSGGVTKGEYRGGNGALGKSHKW